MSEAGLTIKVDLEKIKDVIAAFKGQRWALIPMLHEIQRLQGYIPPEVIPLIASSLRLFPAQVQGVITFYEQFYTTPRGQNVVRVCRGTACHVRGGKTILKLVQKQLGIGEGETSPDYKYTLETVACIGVCALAPNLVVNKETHGHMNPKKVAQLFSKKVS